MASTSQTLAMTPNWDPVLGKRDSMCVYEEMSIIWWIFVNKIIFAFTSLMYEDFWDTL